MAEVKVIPITDSYRNGLRMKEPVCLSCRVCDGNENYHMSLYFDTAPRHISRRPAQLQGITSRWPIDMEKIAGDVEIIDNFRLHRPHINFFERHTAVGNDCPIVAHETGDGEWQ